MRFTKIAPLLLTSLLTAPNSLAAPPVDLDGDGIPAFRDCDDTDPRIRLPLRWYLDSDGDGFGDSSSMTPSCTPLSGYVRNSSDCDDTNPFIRRPLRQYLDSDGDGFGDISTRVHHCGRLSGYVRNSSDCDDTEFLANPGLEEICNDGIDNDCDGTPNDCELIGDIYLSDSHSTFTGENGSDYAGFSVSGAGDVNGDSINDILIGAHGEDSGGSSAGASYLVLGPTSGNVDLSLADAKFIGEDTSDSSGNPVSSAGDVNNDGFDDILIAAYGDDTNGSYAGAAYLVSGPVTGNLDLSLADAKLLGEAANDQAGYSVSNAGDFNYDGFDDLLVGATGDDTNGSSAGAAYLIFGPVTGQVELSSADVKFLGEDTNYFAGDTVSAAGDMDGDGFDDVLIGSSNQSTVRDYAGAVYLMLGPTSGQVDLSSAEASLIGEDEYHYVGEHKSSSGDINGDGHNDIIIGTGEDDTNGYKSGAAYLVLGPVSGQIDLSSADAKLLGERTTDQAGHSVSYVGDINEDSFDDIIVGANSEDSGGTNAGTVYLVTGPISGQIDLSSADAKFIGNAYDVAGHDVSGPGDVTGDGLDDILIGAYNSSTGTVYLIEGTNGY